MTLTDNQSYPAITRFTLKTNHLCLCMLESPIQFSEVAAAWRFTRRHSPTRCGTSFKPDKYLKLKGTFTAPRCRVPWTMESHDPRSSPGSEQPQPQPQPNTALEYLTALVVPQYSCPRSYHVTTRSSKCGQGQDGDFQNIGSPALT
jgi:hypothetical protein